MRTRTLLIAACAAALVLSPAGVQVPLLGPASAEARPDGKQKPARAASRAERKIDRQAGKQETPRPVSIPPGQAKAAQPPGRKRAEVPAGEARKQGSHAPHPARAGLAPPARPDRGTLASELKGLNAAHASPTALANAAPNSQVGRIAAYRDAAESSAAALDLLAVTRAELAALEAAPHRPVSEIVAEIATLTEADADRLPILEAELRASAEHARALEALRAEVATLEAVADQTGRSADSSLLAASNGRALSEAARAELHDLLGLPAPYRHD